MTNLQLTRSRKFDLALLLAVVIIIVCAGLWIRRQGLLEYSQDPNFESTGSGSSRKTATVDDWVDDLSSTNLTVRLRAVESLAAAGSPAIPALERALTSDDPAVRRQAVIALRRIGPQAVEAVPGLVNRLKDDDRGVVEEALVALERIGPGAESAVTAIAEIIDQSNTSLRFVAIEALGGIGLPAVPALQEKLRHPEEACRLKAAIQLSRLGKPTEEAAQVLRAGLTDPDHNSVRPIMESFPQLGQVAVPVLVEALTSDEWLVRHRAAIILGKVGAEAKAAVSALVKSLKDENYNVAWSAASALGEIGSEANSAIPDLIEALNSHHVRFHAVKALATIGADSEPVLDAFIAALNSNSKFLHADAARGIGLIGPKAKRAVTALRQAANENDDPVVRFHVAQALWKVDQDTDLAVRLLMQVLEDPKFSGSPSVTNEASVTLGEMGPKAKAAVPVLISFIQDRRRNQGGTPHEAREALKKIDPAARDELGL